MQLLCAVIVALVMLLPAVACDSDQWADFPAASGPNR
jgi:hypothetical protein